MPWVKVDDHFDEHPKFAQVGPLGIALWVAGLAYCNRNLTDGFIPWATAKSLLSWEFLRPHPEDPTREMVYSVDIGRGLHGEQASCDFVTEMLVDAGIWEHVPGGYRVHDFLDYQPSKAEVLEDREKVRGRVEKHRNAKRNGVSNGVGNGVSNGPVTPPPVPVPVPVPLRASKEALSRAGDEEDPVETYHLLTGRSPKKPVIDWLDRLVQEHGARDVSQTMAVIWAEKADLGSFVGDVDTALVLESRRESQAGEERRRRSELEYQRNLQEEIAAASPEETARAEAAKAEVADFVSRLPAGVTSLKHRSVS